MLQPFVFYLFAAVTLLHAAPCARNDLDDAGRPRQEVHPVTSRLDLEGDRLTTGFDPADKGFYQGGDMRSHMLNTIAKVSL